MFTTILFRKFKINQEGRKAHVMPTIMHQPLLFENTLLFPGVYKSLREVHVVVPLFCMLDFTASFVRAPISFGRYL